MSTAGQYTYREIIGQGEAWAASLAAVEVEGKLAQWVRGQWTETLFTGCGSTYYLSQIAAAIWRAWTGEPARAVPGSELWLFPATVQPQAGSLLVTVSRSGETTETLRAIDQFEALVGRDWLTVTCHADRPMAQRAPHALVARQAEEQSVAQTRSFTSMLVLCQALAALASGRPLNRLATLPAHAERLIKTYESLAQTLANDSGIRRFTFLGSGVNYGLACEAMLKMKEMSLSPSEAFHTLEYRHGPKSVVGPDLLIVGLVSDTAHAHEAAVLAEMRDLGAKVLAVAETAQGLTADYTVELGSGLDEITRAPLTLPVLQLLAYYRALGNGLDPDRPTNLEQVIRLE